jgi:hydrogenase nickel incorporation protein HypA/HybF
MHEWDLAEAIVATALEYAKKNGAMKIVKIVVVLGELQAVDPDILRFAMDRVRENTLAAEAEISFVDEHAEFACRVCVHRWTLCEDALDDEAREDIHFVPEVVHAFLKCPACGSRDFEVVSGRGVYIQVMEVV